MTNGLSEIEHVKVTRVTILETKSYALMSQLSGQRVIRQHLGRSLNGHMVVIKEEAVGKLQRALEKQEIYVTGIPIREARVELSSDGLLLLALNVYESLGQWCKLPFEVPVALVKQLSAHHELDTLSLVQQTVEEISSQLGRVIDGWAVLPSQNGLPIEQTLPLISEAIEKSHNIEMTYWSAGRGVWAGRHARAHYAYHFTLPY